MKIRHQKKLVCAITAISLGGLASTPAIAQSSVLEEIVVTAQKRAQNIQDVPTAISAFGTEDLERLNASDMKDLQYSAPNLTISTGNHVTPRIGMRGVSDYSRNPGYDNRVSVYVDGIFVGRSASANQSTLDLDRVEVLRGPQGTLFGKNTVAGAISLTTTKPQEAFSGSVNVDAGNLGYSSLTGTLNGTLVEDRLFGKIVVNDRQRDGYVENIHNGDDLENLNNQSARAQLRWVGDRVEVNFNLDQAEKDIDHHGSQSTNDAVAPDIREVSLDLKTQQQVEEVGGGLGIDYALDNGFELTALTGFRNMEFRSLADEDFTAFPIVSSHTTEESTHYSQELRLTSPVDEHFDYVAGVYYFNQTNESASSAAAETLAGTVGLVPGSSVIAPAEVDVESYAAFVHGNFRPTERWELTAGLRYTRETKELDFQIVDSTGLFTTGSEQDDRSATDLSPKIGINYLAGEDAMLYATYSKAFKSGGWNVDFITDLNQIEFDDEEVDSIELGLKSTLLDGRLRFNAALFRMDYEEFQVFQFVPLPGGGTIFTLSNAGEVTSQGFEAEIDWLATDNLTFWASYGYTDAEFERFRDGGGPGIHYDGNRTPDAPENTASFGFDYRRGVGNGDFVAQADYSYRDDAYTNANNLDPYLIEAYDLWNGRFGYESADGRWSVYAWGKNLADTEDATNRTVSFLGIERAAYTLPRTYGLSFKYAFGAQ